MSPASYRAAPPRVGNASLPGITRRLQTAYLVGVGVGVGVAFGVVDGSGPYCVKYCCSYWLTLVCAAPIWPRSPLLLAANKSLKAEST